MFCNEEGRSVLPAGEGDVLAFIGYLSLEGRVGPTLAGQYLSAISRYHENAGYESPTKTALVRDPLGLMPAKWPARGLYVPLGPDVLPLS